VSVSERVSECTWESEREREIGSKLLIRLFSSPSIQVGVQKSKNKKMERMQKKTFKLIKRQRWWSSAVVSVRLLLRWSEFEPCRQQFFSKLDEQTKMNTKEIKRRPFQNNVKGVEDRGSFYFLQTSEAPVLIPSGTLVGFLPNVHKNGTCQGWRDFKEPLWWILILVGLISSKTS
jgi:hypothetical protein